MDKIIKSRKNGFSVKDIVIVGLMAAIVFIFTSFLGLRLPTPTGTVMLKTANVVCLLGGILFGGVRGGLAAGLGSALFDLTFPEYAPFAIVTFFMFFVMGSVAGWIAHWGKGKGISTSRIIFAAMGGATSYYIIYVVKNIGELMISGSAFMPAVIANLSKMVVSGVNCIFAVIVASILAPVLYKQLKGAHLI